MSQELLSVFSLKAALAFFYLALFVPFWRYVNGGGPTTDASGEPLPESRRAPPFRADDIFAVPDSVHFHPGHAWARFRDGVVVAGIDDFGHTLVGPLQAIRLPEAGRPLTQGEPAWTLVADDGKTVDMLSPVDGTVVDVNERAIESPSTTAADPYGEGWLLKIRASRPAHNLKHLMAGPMARRWTEASWEVLSRMNAEVGPVSLDGGRPVSGMAKAVAPERWDQVARDFFLTGD